MCCFFVLLTHISCAKVSVCECCHDVIKNRKHSALFVTVSVIAVVVCRLVVVTIASVYLRHLITLNCREKRARQESIRDTVTHTRTHVHSDSDFGEEREWEKHTQMSCRDWLDFVICVLCQSVQFIVVLLKINPIIIIELYGEEEKKHKIVLFFSLLNQTMIKISF